jgi:small conductance mechanosensitive channel
MDLLTRYLESIAWEDVILTTVKVLLVLLLFWTASLLAKLALNRLERHLVTNEQNSQAAGESAKRAETLVGLLRQGLLIALWVLATLVVLQQVGVQIGPILASAGVLGLAVGFGAQNLVRDIISGFFIILEDQLRVGDVAIINGTGGLVEKINFRTMVLRDLSGTVHVFPNGTIESLSNMTKEWSAYVFDIGVAYKEDVDQVIDLMRDVGAGMREDAVFGALMLDDVEVFGLDQFGDSAVVIKGRLKTLPIKQWDVGREFKRRLKYAFDRAGIEIPFPHRSLYFGEASAPFMTELLGPRPKVKAVAGDPSAAGRSASSDRAAPQEAGTD